MQHFMRYLEPDLILITIYC